MTVKQLVSKLIWECKDLNAQITIKINPEKIQKKDVIINNCNGYCGCINDPNSFEIEGIEKYYSDYYLTIEY